MKYVFWNLAGLLLLLAACSSPLDTAQGLVDELKADAIGTAISQDSTEVMESMSLFNLSSSELNSELLLACVDVAGDLSDNDFDLVPQEAIYTFNCSAVGRYGVEAALSGQMTISDPSSDINTQGYDAGLSNLNLQVLGKQNTSYNEMRNGTRRVRYGAGFIDSSQVLDIDRTFVLVGLAGTAKIANKLNYRFETSASEPLSIVSALPSGSLELSGTFNWQSGEDDLSFAVSTPQKLQYEASCKSAPLFESGELRASLLSTASDAYIRIVFKGCGLEPDIKFIRQK